MECKYCGYFWQDEDDRYPRCHFDGPVNWAPCEYEEPEVADDPEIWEEDWEEDM